jgi:hypothetical protein
MPFRGVTVSFRESKDQSTPGIDPFSCGKVFHSGGLWGKYSPPIDLAFGVRNLFYSGQFWSAYPCAVEVGGLLPDGDLEESHSVVRLRLHFGLTTPASKERSPGARFCGSKVGVFDAGWLWPG